MQSKERMEWFSTKAINLPMVGQWYRIMQNKWLKSWEEMNLGHLMDD
jgi:hypothetical protein